MADEKELTEEQRRLLKEKRICEVAKLIVDGKIKVSPVWKKERKLF